MTARFAIVCPGQGGQHRDMFELVRSDAHAGALLDGWLAEALPSHAPEALLAEPASLFANRFAQPLIVAATLAMHAALRAQLPAPVLIAGYSVGELSAYAVAGALAPLEAIGLARTRAHLMDGCVAAHHPHALLAVSGLNVERVSAMLSAHGFYLAIENGADSCIVGGADAQTGALQTQLAHAGARTRRLDVGVASHTPYMDAAIPAFRAALAASALVAPPIAVLAGSSGQPVHARADAIDALTGQLTQALRWADCMDALAEAGICTVLELGPGKALADMLRARHPHIAVRSVAEFRTLAGVAGWITRHTNAC